MSPMGNQKPFILGVIPARGGSKSIPRKNIKMMAGKPLIAWTIESAKKSKYLNRFVVSTEDKEISDIARSYGAEVLDRPAGLAGDEVMTLPVLSYVLTKLKADIIVLLQPTSPIRDDGLIDKCIEKFLSEKADSLATGFICKFQEYGKSHTRRQDIKGFFYDDGNVYVIGADLIRSGKMTGDKKVYFFPSREENVEIDDEFDFWLAETILKKRELEKQNV